MPTDHADEQTRNGGLRPVPDPTVLTSEAVARTEKAIHDWAEGQLAVRDERLAGIDEATKLRLASITDIPHQIDERVDRLADLTTERFTAIQTQFRERDIRFAENAVSSKEAVAAALMAQKEAAARQDEANAKAIDKSERATAETIKTNQELGSSKTDALAKSIDELKERLTRIESQKLGATENRTGIYATIGILVTLGLAAMAAIGFGASRVQ